MSEKLLGIVNELYTALGNQDWETYKSHLHPDFQVVESDSLPFAGTFKGMEGFNVLFGNIIDKFSGFEPTPTHTCVGDNHVMVWVDIKLTSRETNKVLETELIEVFVFKDDKLIEMRPFYFDPNAVHSILS